MRSKKELNKEWEVINEKLRTAPVGWAIISLFVTFGSLLLGSPIGFVVGFSGMICFGGYCACISVDMNELKNEWNANGYGLKKYPQKRGK